MKQTEITPKKHEKRIGMYGETPRVNVNGFSISRMSPDGDDKSVWISRIDENGYDIEGGEFQDELFAEHLERFFVKNL